MICEKCQKEVNDSANFCPYCGYNFKETNTKISNSKGLIAFLISIICIVLIFIIVAIVTIPRTPEYAIYKACTSIKNNNYEQSIKYVNIDKIVNNRINSVTEEMYSAPELKNNPFAGLAYMFIDAITEKLKVAIKEVANKENIFKDVSEPKLIYLLIVKSYNNLSLKKETTDNNQTIFTFSDKDKYDELNIVLDNPTKKHWEIVDLAGYDFWKEYLGE